MSRKKRKYIKLKKISEWKKSVKNRSKYAAKKVSQGIDPRSGKEL